MVLLLYIRMALLVYHVSYLSSWVIVKDLWKNAIFFFQDNDNIVVVRDGNPY